jgi:mRNA interferase MazF
MGKAKLPTHIDLPVTNNCGLSRDSIILLEQVRTLDKKRLRERMGHVGENVMEQVDAAIAVSFGLPRDQLV